MDTNSQVAQPETQPAPPAEEAASSVAAPAASDAPVVPTSAVAGTTAAATDSASAPVTTQATVVTAPSTGAAPAPTAQPAPVLTDEQRIEALIGTLTPAELETLLVTAKDELSAATRALGLAQFAHDAIKAKIPPTIIRVDNMGRPVANQQ